MSLTVVRAMLDAYTVMDAPPPPLTYRGPYGRLLTRSDIEFAREPGDHTGTLVSTEGTAPVPLEVRPVVPPRWRDVPHKPDRRAVTLPTWLDPTDGRLGVHADVPMRLYLQMEQDLGVRLPGEGDVAPRYHSQVDTPDDHHVVLVATTSQPKIKDYGPHRLLEVARELRAKTGRELHFTLLTNDQQLAEELRPSDLSMRVAVGVDAADCVDLFGGAALVVGNDTGLTHLAALTVRPDGTGPQVLGLYNMFSPLKWVTGSPRHHTLSTAFASQLAIADVDICATSFAADIEPALWGERADLGSIPPGNVAGFAAEVMSW
ncbi:glycosyltransferase family 9 protein [Streptomyces sp. NPDC102381]|uniref:glycosyltransferase family 9 protein n=1 Tax=Streptomyces sp. NPDC102381 TaxID=3366164 RepID=UPI0038177C97